MPARICVLGPVELFAADGTPVALAPRVRRLLAGLAVHAGTVSSVDRLAEVVWGDDLPDHLGNAVQTLVSRLRRAIRDAGGGPEVLTHPEGYALLTTAESCDTADFRGLLSRARATSFAEDRVAVLTEALALWRGEAYGLLAVESFAREEAVALTELRAGAVAELAEAELTAGQPGAAQERLTALVVDRPYDERPVLLLMRCLDVAGRTGEALAVYADLRRRLRDDLGLEPSPEAAASQRALLRSVDPSPQLIGLPPVTEVIGRGPDERALSGLLTTARLVTVVGPGGIGKTTLANRVARQLADGYADGVVVSELARLEPGDDVAAAVCTVLQLPVGRAGPRHQLFDRFRTQELLLVLDNCEHLVADVAELVDRLLAECPGLRVLATSRAALRLSAEHVLRLNPLPPAAAAELFRRRARRRLPDFDQADPRTGAAVDELCRRLDGLPLAIELAASRVDLISPPELLERWSWHQSVLRGGPAGDPRHRSLTALIDWSYDRLPPEAQRTFELLSVFAGEYSLGDATELLTRLGAAGDPGWPLATLVDSSLVARSPATGRLQLLETIREYGRRRLAERPGEEAVRAAHATLYADRAVAGRAELYGPGHLREIRRLLAAVDEVRAAFGWAVEHRPELAARMAGGTAMLVEHALLGEAVGWAELVLARSELPRDPWVVAVAAAGARFTGDLARAGVLADESIALAAADASCLAYGLAVRADVALFTGDLPTVPECWNRVAGLVTSHREVAGTGQMIECTALLARRYGGEPVPVDEAAQVRLVAERTGRTGVADWARYVEGELLLSADPARAYAVLEDALGRARVSGDEYLAGVALVSAASAAHRSGRAAVARRLFADVIRHWQVRGDLTHQWTTLRNVVQVLIAVGQRAEALTLTAALLVAERGAAGYGDDATLLTATARRLTAELGPAAPDLLSEGRGLRDEQVIEFAWRALAPAAGATQLSR